MIIAILVHLKSSDVFITIRTLQMERSKTTWLKLRPD